MSTVKARRWLWTDLEATGLAEGNDYSRVHVMEVAIIVTDFNLNRLAGYHEPVRMHTAMAEEIRKNQFVRDMHTRSGLLKACIKDATMTLAEIESEVIDMLQELGEPGEFQIAGSGVAQYDQPLIKEWMPTLNTWIDYAPFDIGIMRRGISRLVGREVVTHTPASYGAEKLHRALADVEGHIAETEKYQEVLRAAFPAPEGKDTYINPAEATFLLGED